MRILVTGGAGLVGSHCAEFFAKENQKNEVIVLDNLMRSRIFGYDKETVEFNWNFLKRYRNIERIKGDVRNDKDVERAVGKGVDVVIHTAGQPGVPSSVRMPKEDFSINAFGTLNVLEAARKKSRNTVILYCSTNKVYGENVDKIALKELKSRYAFLDIPGVSEEMCTDLTGHTPYGVSKLVGDLYVQEYSYIYKMKTAVFRMSCLAKGTRVATPQGSTRIEEIEGKKTKVFSFNDKIGSSHTRGSFKTKNKGKVLYKIRTKRGYEIKATGDHKFFTPGGYKCLDSIDYGSLVATCPEFFFKQPRYSVKLAGTKIISEEQYAKHLVKYRRKPGYNLEIVKNMKKKGLLPFAYDNPAVYLIANLTGYLTGDGHLYHRFRKNAKSYTEIQVYALPEEIENIKEGFRELGFLPGKTRCSASDSVLSSGKVISGLSYRFSVTQTEAFAFFEMLGVPVGNKSRVRFQIPLWIEKAPKDVQDEYLAGLFGAEMSAPSFKKRAGRNSFDLQPPHFTQSKTIKLHENLSFFRKQIVSMLKARGIQTRAYIKKADFFSKKDSQPSICFDLVVKASKENILNLAKIGFAFNEKRKTHLYKMAEFLKTGLPYERYNSWEEENTRFLQGRGLLWDSIVEKKRIPMENIYDITVPGQHNFFANGLLVHNCTYGTRQFGFEDQGWVAWFIIAALFDKPITIYGNGKQVRDMLYVDDLVDAFGRFINSGLDRGLFNIGGGPKNTISLLEFLDELEKLAGRKPQVNFSDWRPSDQKVYITDTSKLEKALGWKIKMKVKDGIRTLTDWIKDNESCFS
ncbi:MAG: NAD-dependent epimerase/dehydratase family protein [Candidatus Omnitrophica bacterium]|nr:NAD-dependent epimerase/dehydratase family protein [Candidatus Omnitrophota bacterium]